MSNDAANQEGAQRDERQQRLAAALRRNLKRRKAQARGRGNKKPAGESGVTLDKKPGTDGN